MGTGGTVGFLFDDKCFKCWGGSANPTTITTMTMYKANRRNAHKYENIPPL